MNRVRYLGLGYVLAVVLVGLNFMFSLFGSPAPYLSALVGTGIPGAAGLTFLGWLAIPVALICGFAGDLSARQWWLVGAIAAWTGAPAISMTMQGSLHDGRFWSIAVIGPALAIAAATMGPVLTRRVLLGMGWLFGWGSVLAGVSDLLFGWPGVLVGDSRYAEWFAAIGIDGVQPASLNGLLGGRIFVGMTCGLLLVYAVRVMWGQRTWTWIMPLGLAIALAWSLARVGLLALVVGLVAALIPWQRWRVLWAYAAVVVTMAFSLVFLQIVGAGSLAKSTLRWRVELWDTYLASPGIFGPFGLGPTTPPDIIRGHAHNQLLESQATGGWLAVAGLVVFLILAVGQTLRADDNRAALAVVFGAAAIFATDVLTFAPTFAVVNQAFVVLVLAVLGVSARTPHRTAASAHQDA